MKPTAPTVLPKEDIIQKIAGIVTFRGPVRRFERWLDHKLKNYVFELQDGVNLSGTMATFLLQTWGTRKK